jgi:hypothetical protein
MTIVRRPMKGKVGVVEQLIDLFCSHTTGKEPIRAMQDDLRKRRMGSRARDHPPPRGRFLRDQRVPGEAAQRRRRGVDAAAGHVARLLSPDEGSAITALCQRGSGQTATAVAGASGPVSLAYRTWRVPLRQPSLAGAPLAGKGRSPPLVDGAMDKPAETVPPGRPWLLLGLC